MLKDFEKHIASKFPFLDGRKLLIAVSGGIDSVALVYLCHFLGLDITLAHCNFKLRKGDADADAVFVKELANKLDKKFATITFDTEHYAEEHKLSIQMAARKLRYDWFESLRKENAFDYVLTAHHLDDTIETFLINFIRGTGLRGLTGIPEINGNIVRPLLAFSRKQIEDFVSENHIEWREDQSNASTKYTRNKIRHELLPVIRELNSELDHTFTEMIYHLKESQILIDEAVQLFSDKYISNEKDVTKIEIAPLKTIKASKAYLYELLKEYGFTEWNDVKGLLEAQSGKQILSKTHRLIKDRNHLILECLTRSVKETEVYIDNEEQTLESPVYLKLEAVEEFGEFNNKTIYVDKSLLKFPLILRKWEKGDYFYPLGMKGKKKLSKFFKDEKLSLVEKEAQWLLCSEDKILWVLGRRADNRFRITKKTNNILRITC